MKKSILVAVAVMIGSTVFSAPSKSYVDFQKYIAKQITINSSFANSGYEGVVKVKVDFSNIGIEGVNVISGINEEIDTIIANFIKNTPSTIVDGFANGEKNSLIIPVKLVIENK